MCLGSTNSKPSNSPQEAIPVVATTYFCQMRLGNSLHALRQLKCNAFAVCVFPRNPFSVAI